MRNIKPKHINCVYVRQPEALGLGHAVNCAASLVDKEPFAVVLADDLLDHQPGVLKQLVQMHEHYRSSVLAVETIKPEQSLITIESDKASMEVPSAVGGVLKELREDHEMVVTEELNQRIVKLNDVVKRLTAITVLLMLPTLVASHFGMNFEYMPELHWIWGYPAVLLAMMGVALSLVVFFRRKDWI